MFSGKAPEKKFSSGGNKQREGFTKSVSEMKPPSEKGASMRPEKGGGSGKTEITHNPDGSHSVMHHDGEKSEHPNAGHMAAHLHAKHEGGEVGNMHATPEGGAVTHHVGMDGMVEGPMDHASPEEGANHMATMMGGGSDSPDMAMGNHEDEGGLY